MIVTLSLSEMFVISADWSGRAQTSDVELVAWFQKSRLIHVARKSIPLCSESHDFELRKASAPNNRESL